MPKPVEPGIREGRLIQILMPSGAREWAGHHGGLAIVPIIQDFQQSPAAVTGQRGQSPGINEEPRRFGRLPESAWLAALCPS
jgi:hypothetical protein